MAAEASRVLDDDNLLREILVRVGFPTTLVCAALVCKRWNHHASEPAFLRRFRKLNPPRLLGFYLDYGPYSVPTSPCFVPMPLQALELAAVVRCVSSYSFSHHDLVRIENCQNGIISTSLFSYKSGRSEGMRSPLCPERDTLHPLPRIKDQDRVYYHQILAREKDDGRLSHFYVPMEFARGTTDYTVQVYVLQYGEWCKHTSATTKLTLRSRCEPKAVLFKNKIYVLADLTDIFIMDLTNSCLSTIQLPEGLENGFSDIALSRADDSSDVYLIHAKGLLGIWLHKGDCWFAVDTICLRKLDHSLVDEHIDHVQVSCVGDNAEFLFLIMGRCAFYLDIKSRALLKVHERTDDYRFPVTLHPFMMIWPPAFPVFKDDLTRPVSAVSISIGTPTDIVRSTVPVYP